MLDPNSVVKHNERIKDRVGNARQFDVVIRGKLGGYGVLGVMECKDHNRRKGPDSVEAFAKKAEQVGANIRVIVSRNGFTKSALRLAKAENILMLSLLPKDPSTKNPRIFIFWYGRRHIWGEMKLTMEFAGNGPSSPYSCQDLLHEGLPLGDYFRKELTKHQNVSNGTIEMHVTFAKPLPVAVHGSVFHILVARFQATRTSQNKRGTLPLTGDGFFDWQNNTAIIPPSAPISVHGFHPDMADWEDYHDELPPIGPYQIFCDRFFGCIEDDRPVPILQPWIRSMTVDFTALSTSSAPSDLQPVP